MTQQHTPGPWRWEQPHNGFSAIRGPNYELVFGLAAGASSEKQSDDICGANARLIAAAPKLLELVEGFVGSGVEWDGPTNSYVTMQVDRDRLTEAKRLIAFIKA